jgi:hypothetical protein
MASLLACHLSAENYLPILVIHAFGPNLEIGSEREHIAFDKIYISYTNVRLSKRIISNIIFWKLYKYFQSLSLSALSYLTTLNDYLQSWSESLWSTRSDSGLAFFFVTKRQEGSCLIGSFHERCPGWYTGWAFDTRTLLHGGPVPGIG